MIDLWRTNYMTKVEVLSCFWHHFGVLGRRMGSRVCQKGVKCWKGSQITTTVSNVEWKGRKSWGLIVFLTVTQIWHLNRILTVMRFDILTSIWGPFQHLTPFLFNIWYLTRYLRPFSVFETLFIQYLRPYWLFETLFSIWHHFGGHLRPYSLFETLFSIWHLFHSTFETLLVIWDPSLVILKYLYFAGLLFILVLSCWCVLIFLYGLSVFLHGCETWRNAEMEKRNNSFEMNCLRRLLQVHFIPLTLSTSRSGNWWQLRHLLTIVKRRQLTWFWYVIARKGSHANTLLQGGTDDFGAHDS